MDLAKTFKLIRPLKIDGTNLTSTNVTETDLSAWSSATTYASGDYAYVSTIAGTVTISNAAPAKITWANHGLQDGTPIVFTTSGSLPTGLTAGTTYYVAVPRKDFYYVSATPGGVPLSTTSAGSGTHTGTVTHNKSFKSRAGSNLNHVPNGSSADTWWERVGTTNPYRMFDVYGKLSSYRKDSIAVTIQGNNFLDSFYIGGVSAATARLQVISGSRGSVYDTTVTLTDTSGIDNWWSWFYDPRQRKREYLFKALPMYNDCSYTLTLTDTGSTVQCSAAFPGLSRPIGWTEYDLAAGIVDYSERLQDSDLNWYISEGQYAPRTEQTVWVDNTVIDNLRNLLADYRATPALYVASDLYSCSWVYGYYKNFTISVRYAEQSIAQLEIEGVL